MNRKKGYGVIPLDPAKYLSTREMYAQAIRYINLIRDLKHQSGVKDGNGKNKVAWLAILQPPEQRRRARFLAKIKRRMALETAKNTSTRINAQADYRSGTLWIGGARVASTGGRWKDREDGLT